MSNDDKDEKQKYVVPALRGNPNFYLMRQSSPTNNIDPSPIKGLKFSDTPHSTPPSKTRQLENPLNDDISPHVQNEFQFDSKRTGKTNTNAS